MLDRDTHPVVYFYFFLLQDIDGWANFYRNHAKYYKVGTVILDPIDPLSPLPEDCHSPTQPKPAS